MHDFSKVEIRLRNGQLKLVVSHYGLEIEGCELEIIIRLVR